LQSRSRRVSDDEMRSWRNRYHDLIVCCDLIACIILYFTTPPSGRIVPYTYRSCTVQQFELDVVRLRLRQIYGFEFFEWILSSHDPLLLLDYYYRSTITFSQSLSEHGIQYDSPQSRKTSLRSLHFCRQFLISRRNRHPPNNGNGIILPPTKTQQHTITWDETDRPFLNIITGE
jgi:hypothetical protein